MLAVLVIATAIAEFAWNFWSPSDRDFISFWAAAKLALAGTPQLAYDRSAIHAVQLTAEKFGSGEMPFPYAPAFLAVLVPFGLLPFALSMALWSSATFGAYLAAARHFGRVPLWVPAAFPPVYANAAIGQNGFITAALFMTGLALLASSPFGAGLLFGCLIIKPQLGLMLPIALIAARQWRAIAGAAVSAIAVLVLGVVLFGPDVTQAWLSQMPLYAQIARDGLVGWHKLTSVYAFARALGFPASLAFAAHGLVALAGAAAVWRVWRSNAEPLCKAAVLAAATMLASPYLYVYDWLVMLPAYFWLVQQRFSPVAVGLLWCLPIIVIAQAAFGWGTANLAPLVPILLVWAIVRRWQRPSSSTAGIGVDAAPVAA